jgi:hypothetical protein
MNIELRNFGQFEIDEKNYERFYKILNLNQDVFLDLLTLHKEGKIPKLCINTEDFNNKIYTDVTKIGENRLLNLIKKEIINQKDEHMTGFYLKYKTEAFVKNFIRARLSIGYVGYVDDIYMGNNRLQHRRFNMSGYDGDKVGHCTLYNTSIVNEFAYLGIYDHTSYLFLDFYKGNPTLYLKYWSDDENLEFDELGGYGTTDIIYEIFKNTIFTNKTKRRR